MFLEAPDFDVVLDWRGEQEAGLPGVARPDLARRADSPGSSSISNGLRATCSAGGVAWPTGDDG